MAEGQMKELLFKKIWHFFKWLNNKKNSLKIDNQSAKNFIMNMKIIVEKEVLQEDGTWLIYITIGSY